MLQPDVIFAGVRESQCMYLSKGSRGVKGQQLFHAL